MHPELAERKFRSLKNHNYCTPLSVSPYAYTQYKNVLFIERKNYSLDRRACGPAKKINSRTLFRMVFWSKNFHSHAIDFDSSWVKSWTWDFHQTGKLDIATGRTLPKIDHWRLVPSILRSHPSRSTAHFMAPVNELLDLVQRMSPPTKTTHTYRVIR